MKRWALLANEGQWQKITLSHSIENGTACGSVSFYICYIVRKMRLQSVQTGLERWHAYLSLFLFALVGGFTAEIAKVHYNSVCKEKKNKSWISERRVGEGRGLQWSGMGKCQKYTTAIGSKITRPRMHAPTTARSKHTRDTTPKQHDTFFQINLPKR